MSQTDKPPKTLGTGNKMDINMNDIAKMLKAIKMQTKVIESAFKKEADKNNNEPKGVFAQHIDVGDAFAEEFHAKALAEKNAEELSKQIEKEVDNKIEANIQENAEQVFLDGEPDFDLIEEQAEENAPTGL